MFPGHTRPAPNNRPPVPVRLRRTVEGFEAYRRPAPSGRYLISSRACTSRQARQFERPSDTLAQVTIGAWTGRLNYDVIVLARARGTEAAWRRADGGAVALLTRIWTRCPESAIRIARDQGSIVREIDALGGAMGQVIDATGIQFRMLNRRKGPAMHSPRAQADKRAYQESVKHCVERQDNVALRQETVEDLVTEVWAERGGVQARVRGVRVQSGATYKAPAVVLTTGTFLQRSCTWGTPDRSGVQGGTTRGLSAALVRLGMRVERSRPHPAGSTDAHHTADGDAAGMRSPSRFVSHPPPEVDQLPCWITHTTAAVHDLIRANLDRAPMFSGQIQSTGPRYCPSIEAKIVRFGERDSHQLFLEPEGRHTLEVYVNGISTSLPRDVQDAMFRLIPGLQHAQVMRYGYAIEYDYCPPINSPTLESKLCRALLAANQRTTGYEEAAAQGLVAGAMRRLPPHSIRRLRVISVHRVRSMTWSPVRGRTVSDVPSRPEYRMRLPKTMRSRLPPGAPDGLVDDVRGSACRRRTRHSARHSACSTRACDDMTLTKTPRDGSFAGRADRAGPNSPQVPRSRYQGRDDVKYAGYIHRHRAGERQRRCQRRTPRSLQQACISAPRHARNWPDPTRDARSGSRSAASRRPTRTADRLLRTSAPLRQPLDIASHIIAQRLQFANRRKNRPSSARRFYSHSASRRKLLGRLYVRQYQS